MADLSTVGEGTTTNPTIATKNGIKYISPQDIVVEKGWNPRRDFDISDEFVESIKVNGVVKPLELWRNKEGQYVLQDGERRYRGVLKAISQGCSILSVPFYECDKKLGEEERLARAIIHNEGKPLTKYELGEAYSRYIKWGWTQQQIAEKFCCSQSKIQQALELQKATPVLRQAIAADEITETEAVEILRQAAGKNTEQVRLLNEQREKRIARQKQKQENRQQREAERKATAETAKQNGEKPPKPVKVDPYKSMLATLDTLGYSSIEDFAKAIVRSDDLRMAYELGVYTAKKNSVDHVQNALRELNRK